MIQMSLFLLADTGRIEEDPPPCGASVLLKNTKKNLRSYKNTSRERGAQPREAPLPE